MNKCETCGGLHYRLDPCSYRRTANSELLGSTDVTSNPDQKQDASDSLGSGQTVASAKAPDANSPVMVSEQPQAHGSSPCMGQGKVGGQQPTVQLVTAGETAPKFDKTAYMKTYMVKWRKRQKEKRGE